MKLTPALLGGTFAFLASLSSAAPVAADSRITAVTVYTDRAVVTRAATLNVTATGIIEITFEKLPAALIDQSLQLTGRGAAQTTLLDVSAHETYVDFTPNERVKALEDELRALNRQDRVITDRATVLQQQRDYVLKIQTATTTPTKDSAGAAAPADTWLKLLSFTEEQLGKFSAELQSIDTQREDLRARRIAIEQQLNELRGQGGRSYKTVTVHLDATTIGELDLSLRYAVPGASWTPTYDARVLSNEHVVQLGYFGLVRQNTGEDWKAVDLTLSTARPALGGAAPELQPWIVQQRQMLPMSANADEVVTLSPFAVGAAKDKSLAAAASGAGTRAANNFREMASAATVVETQATSATFHVSAKTDVPADNSPRKVGVTSLPLAAEMNYQATPKLVPGAFLTAKVTNTSEFPLLAGAMNVFLNDTFIASSTLRSVMPGEKFDLALGADESITVKRKLNNRYTEDTGVMTKSKRITYDVTFTIQNNKKTAEKLVLVDQIPISRHEKIVVKVLAPPERDVKPEADGTLKWTLSLNPGEKRDVPLKFSVEYPNDFPVVGLE